MAMMKSLQLFLFTFLLLGLPLAPLANATQQNPSAELSPQDIATSLKNYQKQLDAIKQQVSKASTDGQLNKLFDATQALSAAAEKLTTDLQPAQEKLQAQLDVLGPPPEPGTMTETASVAQQRNTLNNAKKQLDDAVKRSQAISTGAIDLGQQISGLRRVAFKSQLALNTGSILSSQFWSPEVEPQTEDLARLGDFSQQLQQTWDASWQEEWRYGTLGLLILAVAIWSVGRYLAERFLAWLSIRYLPDGRLRRSFMALATALTTLFATALALNLIETTFSRVQPLTPQVQDFADGFMQLGIFCALIAGLGRAFLSLNRPSWRLAPVNDEIAAGMRYFSPLLAGLALALGTVELVNNVIGASLGTTVQGNGLVAALMAMVLLAIPLHARRIRRRLALRGEHLEKRSTVDGLVHILIMLSAVVIMFSLLIGYVAFARFLTYQLIWVALVMMAFYFLVIFSTDFCAAIFSPQTTSGRALKKSLNVKDRHLEQLTIIFTAFAKCSLILLMIVALLNGSFGTTTPNSLLQKIIAILSGEGLKSLNIVPGNLLNALICLVIGLYILRVTRRWLSHELLPKTISDVGIRASLITLFSNVGYVLLILITLAALGIQWNNLAWIVSALSVGIGFGLQEIVKNFISGLILLTERPVKVGDMIGIGGVEGDVRRINVRATEIQLSDRSTMIVPNSQLISQNVRNATMGNAQGVVTIALTFPTDIDPEQVRNILLNAYREHEAILDTPAPYVRFSQLGPDGIILSVTGYVASPRMVGSTKSDLLFNILKLLRAQQVSLSSPKEVVFMKQRAKNLVDEEEHSS
ncbi:small-conductance mechanosensitive channel [Serratia fonticola]|uniref:Small-conductance mechanosensitive channel n=1 Tax=Serratia fonticola TaxID=47917 RepID=A0A559TBH9_SERFO|nr:small-conductance mechanosensitive channel [Serratia fonticola]TQI97469.1 small-conductance mechanosensitive channel [Serratia fonticola]TVZ71967.1 small-conductance mechanosensitive channel [Serratia fonticola]